MKYLQEVLQQDEQQREKLEKEEKIRKFLFPEEQEDFFLIEEVKEKIDFWNYLDKRSGKLKKDDDYFENEAQIKEAIKQVKERRTEQWQEEKIKDFLPPEKQNLRFLVKNLINKWNEKNGCNYFNSDAQIKEAIKQVEEQRKIQEEEQRQEERIMKFLPSKEEKSLPLLVEHIRKLREVKNLIHKWNIRDNYNYFNSDAEIIKAIKEVE